jgi:hypothetical protein
MKELALQLQLILQLQLTATGNCNWYCNCNINLGFYEETLIFQLSNFGILIQGLDALG